jgi:hypothetical protein
MGKACKAIRPFCSTPTRPGWDHYAKDAKDAKVMDTSDFRLDPSVCPVRIELDLDPEVFAYLQGLSARSGRSIDELVVEFIDRAMGAAPLSDESPAN